jgi:hypothetical protein
MQVDLSSTAEVTREGEVVPEGQVDHPVRCIGRAPQALEILERAAPDRGAGRLERGGRGVGAG